MSKINKVIKFFKAILKQPSLINLVIDRNENWEKEVFKRQIEFVKGFPIIPIDSVIKSGKIEVSPYSFLDGGSLATDVGLLKSFAQLDTVNNYFEIGTWRGESAANIAPNVQDCYTLNLSGAELKQMGKSDDYINMHRYFSKDISNVIHLEGNSLTYDFSQFSKPFDLVFIDGDHHYNGVKNDTEKVFKHLLHENSIVVWHDYGFSPEQIRFEVMLGILDGVPVEFRDKIYHVSNTLCAVYLPNLDSDIATSFLKYPLEPSNRFKVSLSIND